MIEPKFHGSESSQPTAPVSQSSYWILVIAILFPALLRYLGQPWNLTPVGGIALFAGVYFCDKRRAIAVPLVAMMLSDLTWGLMKGDLSTYTFHRMLPFVYGCYVLYVWLGSGVRASWLQSSRSAENASHPLWRLMFKLVGPLAVATLAGSATFFIITNFGSWLMFDTFPRTIAGLVDCYIAGLPFLRPTLIGDALYTTVFFTAFALLPAIATHKATVPLPTSPDS